MAADLTESVGTTLPGEIERVAAKRERWRGYAKDGMQGMDVGIFLMTRALDQAKAALAANDAVACCVALEDLRGFDSDD